MAAKFTRREFLQKLGVGAAGLAIMPFVTGPEPAQSDSGEVSELLTPDFEMSYTEGLQYSTGTPAPIHVSGSFAVGALSWGVTL